MDVTLRIGEVLLFLETFRAFPWGVDKKEDKFEVNQSNMTVPYESECSYLTRWRKIDKAHLF